MVEAVNYEIDDLILYLYSLKHLSASLSAVLSHIMIVVIGESWECWKCLDEFCCFLFFFKLLIFLFLAPTAFPQEALPFARTGLVDKNK